jgi:hypothetical protein
VSSAPEFETILITSSPKLASIADRAGVTFTMVDLEIMGKSDRQSQASTPIYRHTFDDIAPVRKAMRSSRVLVRTNPVHDGSGEEVERCLGEGAQALMLPYFKTVSEIHRFRDIVAGRAPIIFLFESSEAAGRAEQILDACRGESVHFGLNDLMIALGTRSPFEAFAGGLIDWLSQLAANQNLFFGIGGMGRLGNPADKIPAELVLAQHARLGSRRVILSRSFVGKNVDDPALETIVPLELAKIQARLTELKSASEAETKKLRKEFVDIVTEAVKAAP